MTDNTAPITIENLPIFCVYALEINKKDKISANESESGDEILYLIRKGNYTINTSFKCSATVGTRIDDAVTSKLLLNVTFIDKGTIKQAVMRVSDYSYTCITAYGSEIWDIHLELTESVRG